MQATTRSWFIEYLLRKYPVLDHRVRYLSSSVDALEETLLKRFEIDRDDLVSRFNFKPDDEVRRVVPLGDAHGGGQRACAVELASGKRLMYKPRSPQPELVFASIVRLLGPEVQALVRLAEVVPRAEYHWQQWVDDLADFAPIGSVLSDRSHLYYRSAGAWLAVTYFTATRDMHFENMISGGGVFWGVDLECAFNSVARPPESPLDYSIAKHDSLLSTGILPSRVGASVDVAGANLGAIGAIHGDESGLARWVVENDGTDEAHMTRGFGIVQNPDDAAAVNETLEHADEIADGFSAATREIRRHSEAIVDIIRESAPDTRVIIRPTQTYAEALLKSSHPAALIDERVCKDVIREALTNEVSYGDTDFVSHEVELLFDLDVPLYRVPCDVTALTGEGSRIEMLDGSSSAVRRLNAIHGDQVLSALEDSLLKSLAAYGSSVDPDRATLRSPSALTQHGLLGAEGVRSAVMRLSRSIMEARVQASPSIWHNAVRSQDNRWNMDVSDVRMYDGAAGIFLALAAASDFLESLEVRDFAESIYSDLVEKLDPWSLDAMGVGAYSGAAGIAFALAAGSAQGYGNASANHAAIERLGLFTIDAVAKSRQVDIIGGAAGALIAFTELAEKGFLEKPLARRIVDQCLSVIEGESEEGPAQGSLVWQDSYTGDWLGGISHGAAGIDWAGARLLEVRGADDRVSRVKQGARNSQDSLRQPPGFLWADRRNPKVVGNPPMQAWCHGSEGMIVARVESEANQTDDQTLIQMTDWMIRLPIPSNPCLCHGSSGRYTALEALALEHERRAIFSPTLDLARRAISSEVLDMAMTHRSLASSPLEYWNEGLMIGRAGMVWALATNGGRDATANPLTLRIGRPDFLARSNK